MVMTRRAVKERIRGFERIETEGDDEKEDGKETMPVNDRGYRNECEEKFEFLQTAGVPDLSTNVGER
jgi:hypothetical protein